LSFINCWFSINVHPTICNSCALIFVGVSSTATFPSWWLWYVYRYTLSSRATFGSNLLPNIFYSMLCTLNSYFEILIFTSISMISTSMVFIY
jgi:hypothetical protein